jgi:HEAT repeat protein
MTRVTLLLVLVVSNVLWAFHRVGAADAVSRTTETPTETLGELELREQDLRAELEKLRPPTPRPKPRAAAGPSENDIYRAADELQAQWRQQIKAAPEEHREEIRASLIWPAFASGNPAQIRAALESLWWVPKEFDSSAFHADIAGHLTSDSARTRYAAVRALTHQVAHGEDLPPLLQLTRDEDERVRGVAGRALLVHVEEACEGDIAAALTRLLGDTEEVRSTVLQSGWQWPKVRRVTPELEAAILSQRGERRWDVFRCVLPRLDPKSQRVVEYALSAFGELGEAGRHAPKALLRGVPEPLHKRVAKVALATLKSRTSVQREIYDLLSAYGGQEEMRALQSMLDRGEFNRWVANQIPRVLEQIRRRTAK